MAERYQGRPFPAEDGYDRSGDPHPPAMGESDPLAELARLIGQNDPFGSSMGRANLPVQPRANTGDPYQPPAAAPEEPDESTPAGPPPWMQRAVRQESPQQDYPDEPPSAVHPVQRYATPHAAPEPDYHDEPAFAEPDHESDPSRYDDVLYGEPDPGVQESEHDQAYEGDPYYRDGDDAEEHVLQKHRGGMITVVAVLALAVVGTGAAFAYRTYVGSARSGEPPIIRADAGPTKIVPTPSDGITKVPDRLTAGDGTERIVSREETPVDLGAKSGPRVVFPPLNPNANPPSTASVAPSAPPPSAGNGTLSSNEPRKIKTLSVRGDQADGTAAPVISAPSAAKPAPPVRTAAATPPAVSRGAPSAANASASGGSGPLSLAPQATPAAPVPDAPTRLAAVNPTQTVPNGGGGGGGYLVQVSSQRNEADAQASYRALQGKFPAVLGSRSPLIKRADLGEKGVYYRAMVGPFGSPDEASQFCGSLKSAGGQCVVQRN
jgi:hypothetical protein